jgi:pyrrolidone-carboxylate peptidase
MIQDQQHPLEFHPFFTTIRTSTDPGRYLCNFVYCQALQLSEALHSKPLSLFVHVPHVSDGPATLDLDEQLASILQKILSRMPLAEKQDH